MSFFTDKIVEYGLHSSDTVARFPLGAKVEMSDGRIFRYVRNSTTALVAGNLIQAPALTANHQNIAVASAAAAGSKSVTVTLGASAASANDYAEGFMVVNDVDGEGHTYKIASHPAASASASLVLSLEDPIEVALTTSSEVCLIPNQYNRPVISNTNQQGNPVGVAPIALPASEFGWLQTRGPCSALADTGGWTAGAALTIGAATAGAIEDVDAHAEPQIGYGLQAGVATEFRCVDLRID